MVMGLQSKGREEIIEDVERTRTMMISANLYTPDAEQTSRGARFTRQLPAAISHSRIPVMN
jgi:hypothetical protein